MHEWICPICGAEVINTLYMQDGEIIACGECVDDNGTNRMTKVSGYDVDLEEYLVQRDYHEDDDYDALCGEM